MRIREPKTTALIFASGKMVVTGAKSEDDSRLASRKYARIIQKLGFEAKFSEFKIQNIVGSCDVKFPIRLEGLAFSHGHFSSYEPEVILFVRFLINLLILTCGASALPGSHLPNGQTQGCPPHLCLGQDRLDWGQSKYLAIDVHSPDPSDNITLAGARGNLHCIRSHLSCTLRIQKGLKRFVLASLQNRNKIRYTHSQFLHLTLHRLITLCFHFFLWVVRV